MKGGQEGDRETNIWKGREDSECRRGRKVEEGKTEKVKTGERMERGGKKTYELHAHKHSLPGAGRRKPKEDSSFLVS